ncbi:multidrug resistance efflux pump [Rhizobium sp. BK316]|uniref:hypothetical protein n=1 Tax=Rhizobium sp. BK316 TaxID=2587053 RepID=UPI00161C441A|nr:hypothetical protein [Rhizobium sp. BK316]MBB3411182.1 multidrug resistance efflux pump [Rhizobium sp. BK316]
MAKLDELKKQKAAAERELAALEQQIKSAEEKKAMASAIKANLAHALTELHEIGELPDWIDIKAVTAKDGVINFYRSLRVKKSAG